MDSLICKKITERGLFLGNLYQTFNVKLLFLPNEGDSEGIAQGIAFDSMGKRCRDSLW